MKWKFRIPLFLFVLGLVSGIVQIVANMGLDEYHYVWRSFLFFVLVCVIIIVFERVGINDKKVHFGLCLVIIFIGSLIDYLIM